MVALLVGGSLTDASAGERPQAGEVKRFGVGIAAGFPTAVTMKVFFDPRNAIALHVGPTLVISGLHIRLQFEQTPAIVGRWGAGELGVTWHLGTIVELIFGEQAVDAGFRAALSAGAGVEFRTVAVPFAAFAEVGPVLYPYDLANPGRTPFAPASFTLLVGGRWYF